MTRDQLEARAWEDAADSWRHRAKEMEAENKRLTAKLTDAEEAYSVIKDAYRDLEEEADQLRDWKDVAHRLYKALCGQPANCAPTYEQRTAAHEAMAVYESLRERPDYCAPYPG